MRARRLQHFLATALDLTSIEIRGKVYERGGVPLPLRRVSRKKQESKKGSGGSTRALPIAFAAETERFIWQPMAVPGRSGGSGGGAVNSHFYGR